jgi:biotin carboxyl carrier protein
MRPASSGAVRAAGRDGRVRAGLPARVLQVHVAEGQRIERGQPLVTLSAMKMELVSEAPAAGVVAALACRPGQLVEADALLVEVRFDEEPPLNRR